MELSRREREQQQRVNDIVSKAIDLFCEHGVEAVSMDQVAKESEFTKKTLYRYFQSKEDLYYAAALRGHQLLHDRLAQASRGDGTGFDRIRRAFYAYYDYCRTYPKLAQLVNKRFYGNLQGTDGKTPYAIRFSEVDSRIFQEQLALFEVGVRDGSVRADEDIRYLSYGTLYGAVSFFHLYAFTGTTYANHLNLDHDKFVTFVIEKTLDQIRATPGQEMPDQVRAKHSPD